jgi:hypothetical protein
MKRIILTLFSASLILGSFACMVTALVVDDIKGSYWNANKTAQIRTYKGVNDQYYGKLELPMEPTNADGISKKDPKNAIENWRDKDRQGIDITNGYTWNAADHKRSEGTIYDPIEDKMYDGYEYFEGGSKKVQKIRGYVLGMTWVCRTTECHRV